MRHDAHHNVFYRVSEGGFNALFRGYTRGLDLRDDAGGARRYSVTILSIAASGYLFAIVPKGFFPSEDTGQIVGFTEAAQDTSFAGDVRASAGGRQDHQGRSRTSPTSTPRSAPAASSPSLNNGRLFIQLKPRAERKLTADQVIQELRPKLRAGSRHQHLSCRACRTSISAAGLAKSAYQYTLQDGDTDRALPLRADSCSSDIAAAAGRPGREFRSAAPQPAGHRRHRPRQGRAARHHHGADPQATFYSAFGARADLDHLRAVEQLLGHPRARQAVPADSPADLSKIYLRSADGPGGAAAARSRRIRSGVGPVTVNHQGQLPSVTISFNLPPGISLGTAVERDRAARARGQPADHGQHQLPGQRAGVPGRAARARACC